MVTAAHNTRY